LHSAFLSLFKTRPDKLRANLKRIVSAFKVREQNNVKNQKSKAGG
jgi:hypothetical protein